MRISMLIVLPLIAAAGCGSGIPGQADVKQHMTSEQLALSDPIVNSVGMVLVPVPAGEFQMGAAVNNEEQGTRGQAEKQKAVPESPRHLVKITKTFFISSCEVTQQQYEQVMGACPWKGKPLVKEHAHSAASYVTWDDAVEFCRKLSEQENAKYRLPTEAEWEYACRAGTQTTWSFGDDAWDQLGGYGWYDANAYQAGEQYAHRVAQKLPNAWALYDMHGNVWEWCQDWYGRYDGRNREATDPTGPAKGIYRVWRGGSFAEAMANTRSATRLSNDREHYRPEFSAGFRIVREFTAGQ